MRGLTRRNADRWPDGWPDGRPDGWSEYFSVALAEQRAERRRLHAAALAALLLHGLFFALRLPERQRSVVDVPVAIPFPLRDFKFEPRPVEPPAPDPTPAETVAQPTVIVPGPPEVDVRPVEPAVPEPVVPTLEPLDFLPVLPVVPPPPTEPPPVRYDASIERPLRLYAPLPAYTPAARRIRRQGRVILEAIIDTRGAVVDARIVKGLGFGLDESALETVGTWRFEPATIDGRPIAVIYNLVINFELR